MMVHPPLSDKTALRPWAKSVRDALSAEARARDSQALCGHIQALVDKLITIRTQRLKTYSEKPFTVALYWPFGSEVDVLNLISLTSESCGSSIQFCFPVSLPNRTMEFLWFDTDQLNAYLCARRSGDTDRLPHFLSRPALITNLPSSGTVCPETELDLIVIPGLCFDRQGYRVGYGGGYYDIYLSRYNCLQQQSQPDHLADDADVRRISQVVISPDGPGVYHVSQTDLLPDGIDHRIAADQAYHPLLLSSEKQKGRSFRSAPLLCGVCFSELLFSEPLPHDKTDIPVDVISTPEGLLWV